MLIPWQAPEKQLSLHLLQANEKAMTFYLQLTKPYAFCPSCGSQTSSIHSFYHRMLQDLSIGVQHVFIYLKSRKWFCNEARCSQRIFTERFTWLKAYARRTERLQSLLGKLAFSMSCRQAEKVAQSFLAYISHDTFLRIIRTTDIKLPQTTTVGLDDFAFRKGHVYGTLICDLATHQPLAILPGRTSEMVEAWLHAQPHIQTISRDGSKTYREAITNSNPSITQVSDRWHLIKNAKEAFVKWLEQKLPAQIEWHLGQKYQLSRGTIYNYLKQTMPPRKTKHKIKPAQLKLQPYYEAILSYDAERLTMDQIFQKIHLAGYDGSRSALRRFLDPYRANKKKQLAHTLIHRVSRTQLIRWMWAGFDTLDEEQKQVIMQCQQLYPFIQPVEKMAQEYRALFQNKSVTSLLNWMSTQLANKTSPFYSYTVGLRLDLAAVKNAFTSPYSNGLLEGQVNRLKWIKRMMYGRAKADLLEKRMQYRF